MSFRADVSNSESATNWKSSKASAYLSRSAGRAPTKLSGSSPTSRWRDRHPQEPILRLHQCEDNPGTHSETPPAYMGRRLHSGSSAAPFAMTMVSAYRMQIEGVR